MENKLYIDCPKFTGRNVPITEIAKVAGVDEEYLEQYGNYKAKIDLSLQKESKKQGKLVLVTAITPTPAGEGKTTILRLNQAQKTFSLQTHQKMLQTFPD